MWHGHVTGYLLALNCQITNGDRRNKLFRTESKLRDLNDNFQS